MQNQRISSYEYKKVVDDILGKLSFLLILKMLARTRDSSSSLSLKSK